MPAINGPAGVPNLPFLAPNVLDPQHAHVWWSAWHCGMMNMAMMQNMKGKGKGKHCDHHYKGNDISDKMLSKLRKQLRGRFDIY